MRGVKGQARVPSLNQSWIVRITGQLTKLAAGVAALVPGVLTKCLGASTRPTLRRLRVTGNQ